MSQFFSLRRIVDAYRNSVAGFKTAWRDETAFQQEVVVFVVLLPIAYWLCAGSLAWFAALIGAGLQLMMVELLNTGIEAAIDRIGPERHPQSAKAKDCASAAVLLSALLAIAVWVAAIARFVSLP